MEGFKMLRVFAMDCSNDRLTTWHALFMQPGVRTVTLLTTLMITMSTAADVRADSKDLPNILFILADDLGWNDVGFHGSEIETPHLDQLARDGVVLDQHYVTPVCSSTRAGLLGGRYASRFGCLGPTNSRVFSSHTVTLASALSTQGYETCLTGKWHLGSLPKWGPLQFGFQRSYGCLAGGIDQYLHRYKKGPFVTTWHRNDQLFEEAGHSTDLFAEQAIRWIKIKRNRPFFIYVPFTAVHIPLQEPEEWLHRYEGKFKAASRRHFAASATHMDDAIGRILAALDQTGQRERTLVVFTSDNGGQKRWRPTGRYPGQYIHCPVLADNRPLRGWKGQVYEGGIRVPTVVSWPGQLNATTIKHPVNIVDWLPTFCALTGYTAEKDLQWDGQNIWPLVAGQTDHHPARSFYWRTVDQFAVRESHWKLVVPVRNQRRQLALFDLENDPYEKNNVADDNPDKVARLKDLLAEHQNLDSPDLLPFNPDLNQL